MSSPILAIDGKIIAAGKVPTVEEIEAAICNKIKGDSVEKKELQGGYPCGGNC